MDFTLFGLVPMLFGGAPADTPRALLDEIYQPLVAGQPENLEEHYSDRLLALLAANVEQNAVDPSGLPIDPGAPPVVAFNPFLNGSDPDIEDLTVTEPILSGEAAVALVSFETAQGPAVLSVSMIGTDDGWKVDDIAAVGNGEKWLYSWLLRYDPFGQQ